MCIRSAPSRIMKIKDFSFRCFPLFLLLSCPACVSLFSLYSCNENLQTLVWWQFGHMFTSIKSMKTVKAPSLGV